MEGIGGQGRAFQIAAATSVPRFAQTRCPRVSCLFLEGSRAGHRGLPQGK